MYKTTLADELDKKKDETENNNDDNRVRVKHKEVHSKLTPSSLIH